MARFKAPKFGTLSFRQPGGAHRADPRPLSMPQDDDGYAGAHRREGRHGISPSTRPENRPTPTGLPAGQHRKAGKPQSSPPAPAGGVWYPTKSEWRRMMAGETINGHRLTSAQRAAR